MKNSTRKPTHPGAIIRHDYMEPLDLTVTALAAHLGVSRKHLSQVVNEKAGVTTAMALRLSRAFNTTPELWLNLQRKRDLWEAEADRVELDKVAPLPGLEESRAGEPSA
jgi:addiction module HigA family antidote